jgi:hypothetical protein
LFAGDTRRRAWTWYDGMCRGKSGSTPPLKIQRLAKQLSYAMNRAATQYPSIQGYQKFIGPWSLDTVYGDKIPAQTDVWSCGHRVLLLADMLASRFVISEMQTMYSDDDMLAIHQVMGHHALGLMQDATPQGKVAGRFVTTFW